MSEPGPGDLGNLLARAQEMQTRLAALQRELQQRRFEGRAGGGMAVAEVTGGLRVLRIHLEPSLLESGDREMVQDLAAAAVNAALETAQRTVQEELQRAAGGLASLAGSPGPPADSGT